MAIQRNVHGASIAEVAAAMVLLLPILFAILFVTLEASYAYTIKTSLDSAVREAGRELAIEYGQDPTIAGNRGQQNKQVFDHIRIFNIVNASQQFSDPVFDTNTPPTVTVTATYLGNQFGLPPFPNPDVLNLGPTYKISSTTTYRLE